MCYTWVMKNEPTTFTLNISPVEDHLEVFIPELNITVSTLPGQVKRDDAVDLALARISEYQQKMPFNLKGKMRSPEVPERTVP